MTTHTHRRDRCDPEAMSTLLVRAPGPGPRQRQAAAQALTEQQWQALLADADAEAHRQQADRRHANRRRSWEKRRDAKYAAAMPDQLQPQQNPDNKIGRWWRHGPRVLLMVGHSRTGKTFAAYAIGNEAYRAGVWAEYWTAPDLRDALNPVGERYDPNAYTHATRCDLLILDDLGRERVTEAWLEQLHRIVDARCANNRRLVVTANATPAADTAYDELVDRYGSPVVERLLDDGGILPFAGNPVRRLVADW